MYGLSREWLVDDGRVTPDAIVLSHEEQYVRLSEDVPEALSAAAIGGDPCLDRLAASETNLHCYREALGAGDDTTVVVVSSTWGPDSLLGRNPALIAQLLAELPSDQFVVAAVLHPNIWFAHGPAQIRLWLADCLRAGLRLVPPAEGWQQAVLAADVVIGDNGAVTAYAANLGRAVLLASFPSHQVAPGSAVEALGRAALHLDPSSPFVMQFEAAAATDRFAEVRELASSLPGRSALELRKLFYNLMELAEPDQVPVIPAYAPGALVPEKLPVEAWWAATDWATEQGVTVTRWPADVSPRLGQAPNTVDRHLVVHQHHPRRDLYGNAAIVLVDQASDAVSVFQDRPACVLVVTGNLVTHRDGDTVSITLSEAGDNDSIAACASALRTWISRGRTWQDLPDYFDVRLGKRNLRATLTHRSAH